MPTSGGAKAPPWGEVGALPIWDWLMVLGFVASALSTDNGRGLKRWCETVTLYSCSEFTNPLALRRRWRS